MVQKMQQFYIVIDSHEERLKRFEMFMKTIDNARDLAQYNFMWLKSHGIAPLYTMLDYYLESFPKQWKQC